LHVEGNALISGNLELGSSREYKNNIQTLKKKEAIDALKALRPVRFNYKNDPAEESVGFIAEEVPDLVSTNSRKSLSTMDVVAVLTKVIQEQQKAIEELSRKVDDLEKE
ncbi:MAG: tail fiber domain-containing protein, partial [Desulfobulbaceae bacterium]|nr:tail fiber domain-containing protein [Desulfobulbaceae bacterium]